MDWIESTADRQGRGHVGLNKGAIFCAYTEVGASSSTGACADGRDMGRRIQGASATVTDTSMGADSRIGVISYIAMRSRRLSKIPAWALPCLICTIRWPYDYVPDFLVHLWSQQRVHLIMETKGYDPLGHVKAQETRRWVAAVNAEGQFGLWHYVVAHKS